MAVALDAMGGDHGPSVLVEGAVAAARDFGTPIVLVGDQERLQQELTRCGGQGLPIEIQHASQVVGMDESPAESLRRKKDSTIKVAFDLVRSGRAEAVVSAGNSGATLATALVTLGRFAGVRPAIATIIPTLKAPGVMIDVGANVDCKPHHLFQFGVMGAVFSQRFLGIENPTVGILSIGEEDSKGNQQVKRAHDLFHGSDLNFVGNVEGRDVFQGDVNVVVCDGFVGNICLKLSEGLAESILRMLKIELSSSPMARLGYLLSRGAYRRFRKRVDYSEYGGAPLLGTKGIAIICHGRSGAKAIRNAVKVAGDLADSGLLEGLDASLSRYGELYR